MERQNKSPLLFLLLTAYTICVMVVIQLSTVIPFGDTHTTLSVAKRGDKALFRLYKLHFDTSRLLSDWRSLTNKTSLLVISEPLIRPPTKEENKYLEKWISEGGTLLYLLSPDEGDNSDQNKPNLLKYTSSTKKFNSPDVGSNNSPLLYGVNALTINAHFTNLPKAFHTLVQGEIALRHYGKGVIILVSSAHFITNQDLLLSNNAMFAYNAAEYAENRHKGAVSFDEYHQGLGLTIQPEQSIQSDFKTYWMMSPNWIRYALLAVLAICLMSIYNGNRTFGDFVYPSKQELKKLNTVDALAGLFLKVNANNYALTILEDDFRKSVLRRMELPESTSHAEFVDLCKSLSITSEEMDLLFGYMHKEQANKKISKSELQQIAVKIEEIKRRLDLVG